MKILPLVLSGCILLAVILLAGSMYVVSEWEQVIVTEFGKPVGEPVTEPGLYFKIPFIQTATSFEKRILEWDGEARDILTSDKETIMVNTMARWKIVEPLKFFQLGRRVRQFPLDVSQNFHQRMRLDDFLDGGSDLFVQDALPVIVSLSLVRMRGRSWPCWKSTKRQKISPGAGCTWKP